MSKRIPQAFIDEIISRADIVDVVGRRVSLKRAGANFKGLCPFHDEKTPSFIVTPARGTYHCFGCEAHGTVISFLQNYENLGFREAIEALAELTGLDMPAAVDPDSSNETGALADLLQEADRLYRSALRSHEPAKDYLRRRGIDGTTAAEFGIGYAPDAWDTVVRALGSSESRRRELLKAGLIGRSDKGRYYDLFRNRIVFPIREPRGRVIGFGGRLIGDGEPKYLNSPETALFHKSRSLYGLHEARRFKGRPDKVIVVEGYIDVVMLAQHGIGPAVATLGTATTTDHLRRLTRMADRVVFCFDGDVAGRKAAWRALETALPFAGGSIELKFLLLPEGEDPDSLVRSRGADDFNSLVDEALTLSRFFVEELERQNDLSSADGRARLLAAAKPLLERLPDGVYKALLLEELAEATGLAAETIERSLDRVAPGERAQGSRGNTLSGHAPQKSTLIRKAIALVLHYPAIARQVGNVAGFDSVDVPGARLLRSLLAVAGDRPDITTAHLVERFRDEPEGQYLPRLASFEVLDDEQGASAVLRDSLRRIVAYEKRRQTVAAIKSGPSGRGNERAPR